MSSNHTIVKNTMFMYIRMFLVMGISLYTSRVILHTLGIEDYGIYQAVGGIVGFLSFLGGALSVASSRFLAYELGTDNLEKLKETFSTLLSAHLLLAFFVVAISGIVGPWVISNWLMLPEQRMDAALWCFYISILTAFFRLIIIPYNACVIAHERLSFFAYIGIVEVLIQLSVVYMLKICPCDKLVLYALLMALIQLGILLAHIYYTVKRFTETRTGLSFSKEIFKPILSFSSWSLFANGAIALNNQGILLLLGMFYSPAIVTARAISLQVNMAINQFINSIRTAVSPPIVKQYADGNADSSEHLCITSTQYTYFLMLMVCLPVFLITPFLLELWLGDIPEYTVIFVRIIIIQCLFQVFDSSLYTALYAIGRLKENALLSPLLGFIQFPMIYLLFRAGHSPVVLSWSNLILYIVLGLIVKPVLAVKVAGYDWRNLYFMYKKCLIVTLTVLPIPMYLYWTLEMSSWKANIEVAVITLIISVLCIYSIGLDRVMKNKVQAYIRNHF